MTIGQETVSECIIKVISKLLPSMPATIMIRNREVGPTQPCFIVAEIGINHNGDIEIVRRLIDVAVEAGADAVKFQKRTVPIVYSEAELARPREVPPDIIVSAIRRGVFPEEAVRRLTTSQFRDTTNGDLKRALEFTSREYEEIVAYCREKNIEWFASPWDEMSVDFLERFTPCCYKIASASLTDDGLLSYVRSRGKPIILSTGMSTMEQIEHAVDVLGRKNLAILHCHSTYPPPEHELNLSVIRMLQEKFPDVVVGYSGHERGISTSVNAVALGACVVERHLTLDRTMWGSDQAASLEPRGFGTLVRDIRKFELARGDGVKRVWESELPIVQKLRRK